MSDPLRKSLLIEKAELEARIKTLTMRIQSLRMQSMQSDFAKSLAPHVPTAEELKLLETQRDLRMQISGLNLRIEEDYERIRRVRFWLDVLTLGGSFPAYVAVASVFVIAGNLVPLKLLDTGMALTALALVPVLFVPLWRCGRLGWLTALVATLILPFVLRIFSHPTSDGRPMFTLAVVVIFLFLCGVLKHATDEWIDV